MEHSAAACKAEERKYRCNAIIHPNKETAAQGGGDVIVCYLYEKEKNGGGNIRKNICGKHPVG
jgi:hypothetical protein